MNDVHVLSETPNDENEIELVTAGGMSALARSELECQLDAAHKYKRSITRFLQDAETMATLSVQVAESCFYSLPRGGKPIAGPSVRLAEICASSYGNLHVGSRVLEVDGDEIVAQGVAWDLEKNLRTTVEVRRSILGRDGRRFKADMVTVTGNAAAAIALRNAIFKVVPRAYVDTIYDKVRSVAIGNAKTLSAKRAEILERLQKRGIDQARVLARLERNGIEDIDLEDLTTLIGLGNAVKEGNITLDEAFPDPKAAPATPAPAAPAQDGKRMSMRSSKAKAAEQAGADPETGELPPTDPEPSPASEPETPAPRMREPGED